MQLREIQSDLWTTHQPQRFMGLEVGTRMTLGRLHGSKGLFLHSPVALTHSLAEEVHKLGTVRYVIAPNLLHHLHVAPWMSAWPEAKLFGAPGLPAKRKDLKFHAEFEDGATYPWSEDLDHQLIAGVPRVAEVALCHRASRSLIVSDLGMHIGDESPFLTRMFFRGAGMFKRYGWSRCEQALLIKDRNAFRQSMERVDSWNFDRIILAHGQIIDSGGKEAFRKAFLHPRLQLSTGS